MYVMFFYLVTNVMPQTEIEYVTCKEANLDNIQDKKTLIFSFKKKVRYERHLLRDYSQTLFPWIAKENRDLFLRLI